MLQKIRVSRKVKFRVFSNLNWSRIVRKLKLGQSFPAISCFFILTVIFTCLLYSNTPLAKAEIQISPLSIASGFAGNDVDSKGVLWAGDKNFTLWKSLDNGMTYQQVYRLPGTFDSTNSYSGLVWNVFVDSRDYIFGSAGGTGALFRSTNGGASFTSVLKTNGTTNESFYISMTEDNAGSLYVVTYTSGNAVPLMLKSTNGGASWVKIGSFNVVHFHTVRFNPADGYLYAILGEGTLPDCAKIMRSMDGGASWTLVVKRNDTLGTVYLGVAFNGRYVYVGQDYSNRFAKFTVSTMTDQVTCLIHRWFILLQVMGTCLLYREYFSLIHLFLLMLLNQ
jgi:photosystem II stability/assembly factor-like uncharacterized protein